MTIMGAIRILASLVVLAFTIVAARTAAKHERYRGKPAGAIIASLIGAVGTSLVLVCLRFHFHWSVGPAFLGLIGGYALGYTGQPFSPFFLVGVAVCSAYAAVLAALSFDWAGVGVCLLTVVLAVFASEYLMQRRHENQGPNEWSG